MLERRLADWLDGYLDFTKNSEPPHLFHVWTALSVLAAALQRKCSLPWGTLTFYPNLYVVLVAPSGKARKGTAMGPGMDFLDDLDIKMAAEATTRESLIREMKNSNGTIIYPDGRTEFHASLTIFSQELTVFLGYQNRQLMSDLTDWYDCRKRWTYRTKNMGTDDIIGVWINLIGATTPDLIQTSMPLDAIGGGLTSRMIFVFEQKKGKITPVPFFSQKEIDLRETLLKDLEQIHMMQGTFQVTSDFLDMWIDWYTRQEDNPPFEDDRFSGYFERRPTHVMKLCVILCASRSNDMLIEARDLERAIKILTMTEIKMPYTFSGVGKSQTADVVNRVMTEIALQRECTFAHIMGRFYHDVDKFALQKIIESLEAMHYISTGYKDSEQIIVCQRDSAYVRDLEL